MTEPTAEQVEAERELAHTFVKYCQGQPTLAHSAVCDAIATALARVRKEAHAAGRHEQSKACEAIAVEEMCGSKRTLSERLTGQRIVEAIRALRGRT